jgi:hypothetical protein
MGVGISGFLSGTRFDHDFASRLGKDWNDQRHQRNSPFSRIDFLRNTNNHSVTLFTLV